MIRLLATLAAISHGSLALAGADASRFLVGDNRDATVASNPGGLLLVGGGGDVDDAFRWFLRGVEGGDVVILRASGGPGYNDYLYRELGLRLDSVETIVTHRREASFDRSILDALAGAEAIFIAGGDQSKYVSYWKDSPIEQALNAHLQAGKPLGGSSAGLAIMGEFAYSAMHTGDLTSQIALENPLHKYITIENDFLKSPLLAGVLADTHFSERQRLGRLIVMLNRIERPVTIGLGIDERTALYLDHDGKGRVFAAAQGRAHVVSISKTPSGTIEGLTASVVSLGPESVIDLPQRRFESPSATHEYAVRAARLEKIEPPSQTPSTP